MAVSLPEDPQGFDHVVAGRQADVAGGLLVGEGGGQAGDGGLDLGHQSCPVRQFGVLLKQLLYFDRYARALAPGLDLAGGGEAGLGSVEARFAGVGGGGAAWGGGAGAVIIGEDEDGVILDV